MDEKYIDAYLIIDKAFDAGIFGDDEILRLVMESCEYNYEGAVMALSGYYEHKKQIKTFIKKNNLAEKQPLQMGE